jgi:ferric-dicitrate binding protein FerR (iron transport regulator)
MATNDYALQITPGTRLTVPDGLRRWLGRRAEFAVLGGEARVVTGPGFPGARLEISTTNAQVDVIGTTFAVIADADSTCVCVLEGTAQLSMGSAPAMPVPPMMRGTIRMPDGSTTMEPIRPMEERKLSDLRASAMPMLESR